jgi:hypothetical protein
VSVAGGNLQNKRKRAVSSRQNLLESIVDESIVNQSVIIAIVIVPESVVDNAIVDNSIINEAIVVDAATKKRVIKTPIQVVQTSSTIVIVIVDSRIATILTNTTSRSTSLANLDTTAMKVLLVVASIRIRRLDFFKRNL